MFGRHPRLAIDAFLEFSSNNLIAESKQGYGDKLKEQLYAAYDKPSKEAKHAGQSIRSTMTGRLNSSTMTGRLNMLFFNLEIVF